MEKGLIIGAGAIGKGVIAPILQNHGLEVTFANRSVSNIMGNNDFYSIYSENGKQIVKDVCVCGLYTKDFEHSFSEYDVIILCLDDNALPMVFKELIKCLKNKVPMFLSKQMTILICSNHPYVVDNFIREIDKEISKQWREKHLEIKHVLVFIGARKIINSFDISVTLQNGFIEMEHTELSLISKWDEFKEIKNINNRLMMKLALINRSQLHMALLGVKKYKTMKECLNDKQLMNNVRKAFQECEILLKKYYGQEINKDFCNKLWTKIENIENEPLERYLRNIELKLGTEERIEIPIKIAKELRIDVKWIQEVKDLAIEYLK